MDTSSPGHFRDNATLVYQPSPQGYALQLELRPSPPKGERAG
jgi:hypothetical protein